MQYSITLLSALTAVATATTHSIAVGQGGLTFSPANLTAETGDTVVFSFYPSKHSVVQATFDKPCVPSGDSAFFSGALATTSGVNTETWTLTVNDTKPIWFYCSVGTHCASGMVGSINAATTGNKTIDEYILAAKATKNTTVPTAVQGGVLAAGTNGTSNSTSSGNSSASAGIETRGSVQWTTLLFTGAVAVVFGGLIM